MPRVGFAPSLGNTAGLLVAAPGKGSAAGRGGEGARHTGGLFGGRCLSAEASDSGRPGNHGRGGKAGSPPPGSPRPPSHRSPREGGREGGEPGRARWQPRPRAPTWEGPLGGTRCPPAPAAEPGARAQPHSPAAGPAARAQAARAITLARRRGQPGRAGGGLCRRGRPSGFGSGVRPWARSCCASRNGAGGPWVACACGGQWAKVSLRVGVPGSAPSWRRPDGESPCSCPLASREVRDFPSRGLAATGLDPFPLPAVVEDPRACPRAVCSGVRLPRHCASTRQAATEQLAVPYKQLVCESHSHCSMSQRSSRREHSLAKDRGWEAGDVLEVGTTWPRHLSGDAVPAAFSTSVYGRASFPACPAGAGAGPCPQTIKLAQSKHHSIVTFALAPPGPAWVWKQSGWVY